MTELERLQDRVFQLEEILGLKIKAPGHLGLTNIQEKMAGMLVKRDLVSKGMFLDALYSYEADRDQPDVKTVEVHLTNLRRKLSRHGIAIKNRWNVGWYIEADERAKLKGLMSS